MEILSIRVDVSNGAERLDTPAWNGGIEELLIRPPGLDVGVRRRQGLIVIANGIAGVRSLRPDIADGQRGVERKFALNIEAPLPHIAMFIIRRNVIEGHGTGRGRNAG